MKIKVKFRHFDPPTYTPLEEILNDPGKLAQAVSFLFGHLMARGELEITEMNKFLWELLPDADYALVTDDE